MTPLDQVLVLFAGIAVVLVIATAIGRLILHRQPASGPSSLIENLNTRINAWWVMVALVGLAFVFGKVGVILLFAVLSFAALREFLTLTYTRRGDHWTLLAGFFAVLPIQYALVWVGWYGLFTIYIPVYAFLFIPIISALHGDPRGFLERVAEVQWGLMICVFCLSHVPALLTLEVPGYEGRHLLLIAFLLVVVQISDVLQYVWGQLLGRHKIAPTVSPSKTIEGFAGGILSATTIGAGLWWITPFNPWQAGLLAFALTIMGFLGGLVMSAIKRDRGVKDWGSTIEGHGGILDRLDSLVFAAPIFFHLVRYWWAV